MFVTYRKLKAKSSSLMRLEKTEKVIVKGWNSVKSGAQKLGEKIKKTDVMIYCFVSYSWPRKHLRVSLNLRRVISLKE